MLRANASIFFTNKNWTFSVLQHILPQGTDHWFMVQYVFCRPTFLLFVIYFPTCIICFRYIYLHVYNLLEIHYPVILYLKRFSKEFVVSIYFLIIFHTRQFAISNNLLTSESCYRNREWWKHIYMTGFRCWTCD